MAAMFLRLAGLLPVASFCLFAAVAGMEVTSRADAGPGYERIKGKVSFAVDPASPANALITDVKHAARNAQGLVEFAADFEVLKPWDPRNGNGTLLVDVVNRGNHTAPGTFDEKWLMAEGYTVAWIGWQPDVPLNANRMRLYSAVAQGVKGMVRSEFRPEKRVTTMNLADRDHLAYPVAPGDDAALKLTVRDTAQGAKKPVARAAWSLNSARTAIEMGAGFQPGKIYEIVYPAQDPWLIGLGPAAIRDFVSFLRYGGPGHFLLADQQRFLKRTISFGVSQSGRFLRTFLYYGFNLDEKGKPVFDGVYAHVAGAGRGSFNHRFAQPSRDGHPTFNFFYPSDLYPFTDLPVADAVTGAKEGLLDKAVAQKAVPKIFYTNGSYEYWGRAASLVHTTPDGQTDAELAPTSRVYFIAGTQHGPGSFPPAKAEAQKNLRNSVNHRPILRALLADLNAWIKDGTPPPDSVHPSAAKKELAAIDQIRLPKGVEVPKRGQMAWRADYGPRFKSEGIIDQDPPRLGAPYTPLVPRVDDDGNETSGVKMPQVAVPLAAYTGWNPAAAALGTPGDTYAMVGSTLPFPKAKILEKYGSKDKYLERVRAAVDDLLKRRFLLERDAAQLVSDAGAQWDWFMNLN